MATRSVAALLLVLAGCTDTTSAPPGGFNVNVRASTTPCSFEMYSPVSFSTTVAIGEEKRATVAHEPGRFPLGWRARAETSVGATELSSGLFDSTTVPGGFAFVC